MPNWELHSIHKKYTDAWDVAYWIRNDNPNYTVKVRRSNTAKCYFVEQMKMAVG